MNPRTLGPLPRSQFLNRPEYPIPGDQPVQVTLFQHLVRPHRGMVHSIVAVMVNQELGASVDFEVGGHGARVGYEKPRPKAGPLHPRDDLDSPGARVRSL